MLIPRAVAVRPAVSSQIRRTKTSLGREGELNQKWSWGRKYFAPAIVGLSLGLVVLVPQRPCQTSVLERRQDPRVVGSGSWRKELIASPRVARGVKDLLRRKRIVEREAMVRRLRKATAPRKGVFIEMEQIGEGPGLARQNFMEDLSRVRSVMVLAVLALPLGMMSRLGEGLMSVVWMSEVVSESRYVISRAAL